jgi:excisionase family DNA binding protein
MEYTVKEAAQILGVKIRTLRSWMYKGKVPYHKDSINYRSLLYGRDLKKLLEAKDANKGREPAGGAEA